MLTSHNNTCLSSAGKSTENCVCILHNLSYQMESELPNVYTRALKESKKDLAPKPKTVGCFANRGAKITEVSTDAVVC